MYILSSGQIISSSFSTSMIMANYSLSRIHADLAGAFQGKMFYISPLYVARGGVKLFMSLDYCYMCEQELLLCKDSQLLVVRSLES